MEQLEWVGAPFILLIPFHSIFFLFFSILQTIPFHSNFFNYFFQLSKSLYNIFKSQQFISLRNLQSQTIFQIIFQTIFQIIFKPFEIVKNDQNDFPKHMVSIDTERQSHILMILPKKAYSGHKIGLCRLGVLAEMLCLQLRAFEFCCFNI